MTYVACTDGEIRTDGNMPFVGRVEVCYNNSYGTVCDDFWDDLDATVVCNSIAGSEETPTTCKKY